MSTLYTAHADIEDPSAASVPASGGGDVGASGRLRRQRRRRRRRPNMAGGSSETVTDGSFRFTESEAENNPSWQSPVGSTSTAGGVGGEGSFDESAIHGVSGYLSGPRIQGRKGSWDDDELDLESGELELMKAIINANKEEEDEKECRICHLSLLEYDSNNDNGGGAIELGCDCKGDLGTAHKQCAETWFKIRGNTICEICGAVATNVVGEQTPETSNITTGTISAASTAPSVFSERRNFLHGRRIMNFLLGCMVFAFIISWLFHFNVLP